MKIETEIRDDHALLALAGEFDTIQVTRFQETLEGLHEQGIAHVILQLRLVKFINSTALGAIIKAHKRCKAEGGELVIDRPSQFVGKIVRDLGIDRLVPIFDSEEAATRHVIKALNARELSGRTVVEAERVRIVPAEGTPVPEALAGKTLVGTMSNVDAQSLTFRWDPARHGADAAAGEALFAPDHELHLQFRLRLARKGLFDTTARVTRTEAADDGALRVTARLVDLSASDAAALSAFAQDMSYLKQQLPRS